MPQALSETVPFAALRAGFVCDVEANPGAVNMDGRSHRARDRVSVCATGEESQRARGRHASLLSGPFYIGSVAKASGRAMIFARPPDTGGSATSSCWSRVLPSASLPPLPGAHPESRHTHSLQSRVDSAWPDSCQTWQTCHAAIRGHGVDAAASELWRKLHTAPGTTNMGDIVWQCET
jgi:hypothetical protein